MSTTDKQIRERVESFVKELEALIRQAAVTAVADVLGVGARPAKSAAAPAAKASRAPRAAAAKPAKKAGRPGRPAKAAPAAAAARSLPERAARGGKKRIRRTLKELDAVGGRIADFVAKNPGQRAEQIKKALKLGANDWALPIKKLVDERRVTAKGQKRATTYFAAK